MLGLFLTLLLGNSMGAFNGKDAVPQVRDADERGEVGEMFLQPPHSAMNDEGRLCMFCDAPLAKYLREDAEDVVHAMKMESGKWKMTNPARYAQLCTFHSQLSTLHFSVFLSIAFRVRSSHTALYFPPFRMTLPARATRRLFFVALWIGMIIGATTSSIAANILGSSLFSDVRRGSSYDAAIGEMVQLGIMSGVKPTQFKPNTPVKRGELALILKKFRDSLNGVSMSASTSSAPSNASATSASSSAAAAKSYGYNPAGYMRFTTTLFSVNEAVGTATIAVVRTGGNQGTVTVDYALIPGTALAGTDYVDTSGTLTFANKETSKKIEVHVKDDGQSKTERTFQVELKNPQNGAGMSNPDRATVRILDRFASSALSSSNVTSGVSAAASTVPAFYLSATAYGAAENEGALTVNVIRGGVTSTAASVNYATNYGSASATEHTPVSGKFDFAANETVKSFSIAIPDDTAYDGGKTVNITLSNPTNGAILIYPSSAIFTMYDNESSSFGSGSVKLSKKNYDATEGSGKAVVTVMRVGGTKGTATVGYAATGGTATEGTDYVGVAGTLTFAPGEASKTFDVPLMKDSSSDSGETIGIVLSSPTGTLLGDPTAGTVTIAE